MNRIIKIEITLNPKTMLWMVAVTKEFAPQHGGGTQTFREVCYGGPHTPLDVARGMVTLSAGSRTDL